MLLPASFMTGEFGVEVGPAILTMWTARAAVMLMHWARGVRQVLTS